MPLIHVSLAKGRSPEQLQALGPGDGSRRRRRGGKSTALTAAVEESIGAPRESIRVVLTECEPQHWFVGGETLADLRASGRR
jgi:4-oxalocrotonate tautomerase